MKLKTTTACTGGACLVVAALATSLSAQQPVEGSAAAGYVAIDTGAVALTGVTLIDGTGEPARHGQTIVTSGSRIAAVGPQRDGRLQGRGGLRLGRDAGGRAGAGGDFLTEGSVS